MRWSMDNTIEQTINTENKPELADVFSRTAAFIVDTLILLFFTMIIVVILIYLGKIDGAIILAWLVVVFSPLYFMVFEMNNGKTPGKKILDIKVVDREFGDIGFVKALVRNITKFLPFWPVAGALLIALTKKRQRLGDMLAGTLVIKVKYYGSRY